MIIRATTTKLRWGPCQIGLSRFSCIMCMSIISGKYVVACDQIKQLCSTAYTFQVRVHFHILNISEEFTFDLRSEIKNVVIYQKLTTS